MRTIKFLAFGFLASVAFSIPVLHADTMPAKVASEQEAEAVYASRSDFMKGLGASMKAFGNFLKRGEGEPLELASMAAEIAATASEIPSLFPQDTGMAQNEESEAKPEIWENWSDFVAASEALVEPAMAVEAAFDGGDNKATGAAVKALGFDGCRGCHSQFREKKN